MKMMMTMTTAMMMMTRPIIGNFTISCYPLFNWIRLFLEVDHAIASQFDLDIVFLISRDLFTMQIFCRLKISTLLILFELRGVSCVLDLFLFQNK